MYALKTHESIQGLAEEQAKYCRVFSNTMRVQILWALSDRELSVGAIAEAVGSSLQNVSQHLARMKDCSIVSSRRDAQTIYYRIDEEVLRNNCLSLYQSIRLINENFLQDEKITLFERSKSMTALELSMIQSAKVVDARSSACPGPLLEAKKGIGVIKVGEVLEVWSGDPNTKNDIPRWCEKVGHEYLGALEAAGYDRIFLLRKK